jgi:1,4-dihydroxy-2-naphthoate octaprenyltransferase
MSTAPAPASGLGLWVAATRPLYVLTSLIPALAGALVAIGRGSATWWLLPVAMIALALVHAATNACNDVEDSAHGVDSADKLDSTKIFTTGLLSIAAGRRFYAALFAGATVLGIALCVIQGPALLVAGVLGVLGGWLYTGGPWPYKYAGLGDPAIILLMGPLLTQGAYTAVTGDAFHAPAFWLGLGPGLLIAAVLAANNASDIDDDGAAGIRTLAVRIGFRRARAVYLAMLGGGFLVPPLLWAAGLAGPWILLPLVLVVPAARVGRQALAVPAGAHAALRPLVGATAQVHMLYGVLLCVAVVLDRAA